MYDIEAVNKARVVYYGLFSALFTYIETNKDFRDIKSTINYLKTIPLEDNSKKALENMSIFLTQEEEKLKEENNQLFFSPTTTFIPMTASYYDEGRDDGKKRIEMINILLKSNFRKDTSIFKDSEDDISFILKFIQSNIDENLSLQVNELIKFTFETILNNFIDEFINNIYNHESSEFYKDTAILLKIFIELERSLLTVGKNESKSINLRENLFEHEKKEFKQRAKRNFDEVTSL